MAEGAPLLREYTVCSRIEGSNPSLTAIFDQSVIFLFYKNIFVIYFTYSAPVAQLDRVPGYEPGGQRFESSQAHHF